MSKLQILCVTMHQKDFSKIKEMNIHSDVIFANQADRTEYTRMEFDGHTAQMITTDTRGVGKNRNLALLYADAEYCLFADDDVVYLDNMEETVIKEFETHPDADIMIFHLYSDHSERKQIPYKKTKRCGLLSPMPWGGCRIAFRLEAVRKANLWFHSLFGGGCVFPSGEDSLWLREARKKGLTIYVSKETIGSVSFENSSWYTGRDEKHFYAKGAYCQAVHSKTFPLWALYYASRIRKNCTLSWREKLRWIYHGKNGYNNMLSYEAYRQRCES